MDSRYFDEPTPRILGHRGAAGLAPENTLVSFEKALEVTQYIETDAWLTKDCVPVFFHDESALRTCGVDKKVSELSFAEIQELDAAATFKDELGELSFAGKGLKVPSVESVFQELGSKAFFNIEIKDPNPDAVQALWKHAETAKITDKILLAAENDEIMARIRETLPNVPTSASYGEVFQFLQMMLEGNLSDYSSPAVAFQIPDSYQGQDLGGADIIEAINAVGKEVHYWTINDKERMKELVEAGADGIVTDFPNRAQGFAPST